MKNLIGKIFKTKKDVIYISVILLLLIAVSVLSVLLVTGHKEDGGILQYYNEKCAAFELENANLAKGQIVFIGDSITDGYVLDDYYSDLTLSVYNRGIGGDSTGGVLKRLDLSVVDIRPSKVVLMIGINDINGGVSDSVLIKNYGEILEKIKRELPKTEVYCMSILPVNKELESYGVDIPKNLERVKKNNIEIKRLAEEYGYCFVDLFENFLDSEGHLKSELSIDGIHLNANGYRLWTEKLKPYLG